MSQKALKKKEMLNLQRKEREQYQLYQNQRAQPHIEITNNNIEQTNLITAKNRFSSTPNIISIDSSLRAVSPSDNTKETNFYSVDNAKHQLVQLEQRGHSESDVTKIPENEILVNAKSEFHLKSIASTQVPTTSATTSGRSKIDDTIQKKLVDETKYNQGNKKMAQRSFDGSRMSSVTSSHMQGSQYGFADTEHIRIPIIGYEVMEERARFTVFKLRIENPFTNDCWLVLRRYTDFQRLNNKLKTVFPHLTLALPRKKLFGDNFSSVFLSNRLQGLQMFINSIMGNETLRNSQFVRDFFCLDEPPTYSESMEECRAIFEAQEETISHLKLQIRSKDEIILDLQQQLANEIEQKESLANAIKLTYANCVKCSKNISNYLKENCVHIETGSNAKVNSDL